ncbi:hypothetical protein EVAR_61905_1 [Eumeta japonica]|uniref:Uncharacterized protein n=1 Tax=Eumeta variegata TaxID=151549 RepID=A0A4C1YPF4_EUMVA|nr:hypothetical protein EVAR_61905_1 [Eumeta japonica]
MSDFQSLMMEPAVKVHAINGPRYQSCPPDRIASSLPGLRLRKWPFENGHSTFVVARDANSDGVIVTSRFSSEKSYRKKARLPSLVVQVFGRSAGTYNITYRMAGTMRNDAAS